MGIIVVKPDGSSFPLVSSKNKSTIAQAEQTTELLGSDTVTMNVISAVPLDFGIGDTIEVFGGKYTLNALPEMTKKGNRVYAYNLIWEGMQYELLKGQYLDLDTAGISLSGDFYAMLNLKMFCEMIIWNMEKAQPGVWVLGVCPDTDSKNMSFNNENCLSALQRVCQEFEYEFWIVYNNGKYTINVGTVGSDLPHEFQYGRGKGLYELTRETVDSENIITRLYAFGSERNIKSSYRGYAKRLKLPNADYIEDSDAINDFGIIEATKNWDDIYPRRKGVVTSVGSDVYTFVDTTMDFDLNEKDQDGQTKWIIAGTTPKITFTSGNLSGYTFDIQSYNNSTKTFVITKFDDERGQWFPDPDHYNFQFAVGNNYVMFDIIMPDQYVINAENELLQTAQEYLSQNKYPRVSYECVLDALYLKRTAGSGTISNVFSAGDYVSVKDESMNVDGTVRIQGFTRDVLNPYKYNLSLSDYVTVTREERLISDNNDTQRIIYINKLDNPSKVKENWRTMQEMLDMVFDDDGYFDMDRIRPLSIETKMLSVGAKPEQFTTNIILEPNYNANPNLVNITGGALTHLTIEETPRTWNIQSGQITLQSNSTAYYIYLRCTKASGNTSGQVYMSNQQIKTDENPTYYHFLMGVVHSVSAENVRWITLSYGATAINGRFIKTGRILSSDGKTWFDLDTGEISGRITFINSSGTSQSVADAIDGLQDEIDGIETGSGNVTFRTEANAVPAPPYKKGDMWSNEIDLRICINPKPNQTDIFESSDWDFASTYDNTKTVIDGGVVTSGTIQLAGDSGNILAGITGNGTEAGSIRMWAGADFDNRGTAPFRVTQDGKLYANNAVIGGQIQALSGSIGTFQITANGELTSASGEFRQTTTNIRYAIGSTGSESRLAIIGTSVPNGYGTGVARFENNTSNSFGTNYSIYSKASNASKNIAGFFDGDILMQNGSINLSIKTRRVSASFTINSDDCYISCYNTSDITVPLPGSATVGRVLIFKSINGYQVKFTGSIFVGSAVSEAYIWDGRGFSALFVWDGQYWCYNKLPF